MNWISRKAAEILFLEIICVAAEIKPSWKLSHNKLHSINESCQLETCSGIDFAAYFSTESFILPNGILKIPVKFRAAADAFIALTPTINETETRPLYHILISHIKHGLPVTQIRRKKHVDVKRERNTPGLLSPESFRNFVIQYDYATGRIWVFSEESDMPFIYWQDPDPLPVKYFVFSTWPITNIIQVAFNCHPPGTHSYIPSFSKDGELFNVTHEANMLDAVAVAEALESSQEDILNMKNAESMGTGATVGLILTSFGFVSAIIGIGFFVLKLRQKDAALSRLVNDASGGGRSATRNNSSDNSETLNTLLQHDEQFQLL